ncbi:DUF4214 domain-containing protein [Methylobacterium nigriterrae]|uniref:DUF4214 domain-containing protein n=1 Tax=Methylobacterium nigriterrae TaxID=3127512 RepID=UPI003013887B
MADNPFYSWADPAFVASVIAPALATIEAVANIHFVYLGHSSDVRNAPADMSFTLGDSTILRGLNVEAVGFFPNTNLTNNLLASYGLSRTDYPKADGDIWFNADFSAQALAAHDPGSQVFATILHEVGHTLGLKHPFDNGGTGHPTFTQAGIAAFDQPYFTAMSYGTPAGATIAKGYLATPGVIDIAALQSIYGANPNTGAGDTYYNFVDDGAGHSIYDVGGGDALGTSNMSAPMRISLTPGIGGAARLDGSSLSFMKIANGTIIENAVGGTGNDVINGNSANNYIDGSGGINTYILSGARSSYSISAGGGGIVAADTVAGRDGSDTLVNVQRLVFSDGEVAFDLQGNAGQAYRLYQAALHRTPDTSGLSWHVNRLDHGVSLHDTAANFIASPEFTQLYGASTSNQAFVTALYANVLGRAPDAVGNAYWLQHLAEGSFDRPTVLMGFSESPENHGLVDPKISAGIHLDYGVMT